MILYADNMTGSLKAALETCGRRRQIQREFNELHKITPHSVTKPIQPSLAKRSEAKIDVSKKSKGELEKIIAELSDEMLEAADRIEFERAALLRDQIKFLRSKRAH